MCGFQSRRGSSLWITLAGMAVVMLAVGGWWYYTSGVPALKDDSGRQIAESFLAKIREGNPQSAWDETSAEFKSDIGREDFVRDVRKQPVLKEKLDFDSLAPLPDKPLPLMEAKFHSASKDTAAKTVRVWLGVDHGTWKVERLFVD